MGISADNDIAGFDLYRSESPDGVRIPLTEEPIAANPTMAYELLDGATETGTTYYYWLEFVPQAGAPFPYEIPAVIAVPGIKPPFHTIFLPMVKP